MAAPACHFLEHLACPFVIFLSLTEAPLLAERRVEPYLLQFYSGWRFNAAVLYLGGECFERCQLRQRVAAECLFIPRDMHETHTVRKLKRGITHPRRGFAFQLFKHGCYIALILGGPIRLD